MKKQRKNTTNQILPNLFGQMAKVKLHKLVWVLVISILNNLGCQIDKNVSIIETEYSRLQSEANSDIEIIEVRILEEQIMEFEKLANKEISTLIKLNESLSKVIKSQFELDSLLKENIETRNCLYKNANIKYQSKYEKDNYSDSLRLENQLTLRLNNEIELAENELKILEIQDLAFNDSIFQSDNTWIKHEVEYKINNKRITDTIIFIGFGDLKFTYLTENIFRTNT